MKIRYLHMLHLSLIIILLLSCKISSRSGSDPSSPTDSNPTQAQSLEQDNSLFPLKIVPYNYSLVDAGNGWNNGEVYLAFENDTRENIDLSLFANLYTVGWEWFVETKEGPTYPASLNQGGMAVPRLEISRIGIIPPGLRFTRIGPYSYDNILSWQSASSATPVKVTVKDHSELDFDLPVQNQVISFPFEIPPSNITSFESWANKDLINQPDGIQATFTGRCGNLFYFFPDYDNNSSYRNVVVVRTIYLELQVINHDKFYEHKAELSIPYMLFERDGFVQWNEKVYYITQLPNEDGQYGSIVVGPDQNQTGFLQIIGPDVSKIDEPLPIIVIWDGKEYKTFDAAKCNIINRVE